MEALRARPGGLEAFPGLANRASPKAQNNPKKTSPKDSFPYVLVEKLGKALYSLCSFAAQRLVDFASPGRFFMGILINPCRAQIDKS